MDDWIGLTGLVWMSGCLDDVWIGLIALSGCLDDWIGLMVLSG